MITSWMTLRDLEYDSAVARYMHFGRASEACNVSQPALSSQIKKLEERLGFPIFERSNRRVAITEKGRAVVDQARIVLEEAEKIATFSAAENETGGMRGTLRLGVITTLGPYYVPHFLPQLRKQLPDLQLILREGLTDELLAELRSGELDAVLAARTFNETGLSVFPLFREPFLLAAPKNHPLTKKAKMTPANLRAEDMVLLEDGHCLRDQALEICPQNRRGNIRQFHVTSL
ncbi:MAG: LysR substrate-binding domain-containing protein, partial [Acidobacteriota bacterium]